MKRYLALTGITVVVCAIAAAQETNRVVVPARNTSHPRVVNVSSTHGAITVKAYNGKEVIVEAPPSGSRSERREERVEGMKRIDMPVRGLSVEEEDNVIQVRTNSSQAGDLVISVPPDTSVKVQSTHGHISVEGVRGEVEASSTNSGITLSGISGTVVANSTNGAVKVVMDRVDASKPMSFSTVNGSVDVTLPADIKANVKLRAVRGAIYSDFDMKLSGPQPMTSSGGADGKFKVEFDRTIFGTINGGGQELSFYTVNGRIMIRKKQ